MARIALLGYGRMGKLIEEIAIERGHEISIRVSKVHPVRDAELMNTDVAIEFSTPTEAEKLCLKALQAKIPTVSGTTGWDTSAIKAFTKTSENVAFLHSNNMSLGVNVAFAANQLIAKLLGKRKGYTVTIEETHHIHKLDAPSGTAISLAEGILAEFSSYNTWKLYEHEKEVEAEFLGIKSIREGEVFGDHNVEFESKEDIISLSHHAKSRRGFALGAVLAAEFVLGKIGLFTMQDVLGLTHTSTSK